MLYRSKFHFQQSQHSSIFVFRKISKRKNFTTTINLDDTFIDEIEQTNLIDGYFAKKRGKKNITIKIRRNTQNNSQ